MPDTSFALEIDLSVVSVAKGIYGVFSDAQAFAAAIEEGAVEEESGMGYYALWIAPTGEIVATEGHRHLGTYWTGESYGGYGPCWKHGFIRVALSGSSCDVQAERQSPTWAQRNTVRRLCYAIGATSGYVDMRDAGGTQGKFVGVNSLVDALKVRV
jgi:hypothetical protein